MMNFSDIRDALDTLPADLDPELRGQLVDLALAAAEKAGEPYTYGLPGSDPNVEQLADGCLVVTLIYPIRSGTEEIEAIRLRVPTLGDSKGLTGKDSITSAGAKLERTGVVHLTSRKLAASEVDKLAEEDFQALAGAMAFLGGRFRRTGKTFRTS